MMPGPGSACFSGWLAANAWTLAAVGGNGKRGETLGCSEGPFHGSLARLYAWPRVGEMIPTASTPPSRRI